MFSVLVLLPSGIGENDLQDFKVEDEGRTLVIVVSWPSLMTDMERIHAYWEEEEKDGKKSSKRGGLKRNKEDMNLLVKKLSLTKKLVEFRGRRSEMVKAMARIPLEIKGKRTIDELAPMQCSRQGAKIIYFDLSEENKDYKEVEFKIFKSV